MPLVILSAKPWAHDTTTNMRGSAKRIAAFTLQHGAMLTPLQPEGCVPVLVSCAPKPVPRHSWFALLDHTAAY